MCVCDGVAIPDNQNYITERWLRGDRVSMIRYASAIGAAENFNFKKNKMADSCHRENRKIAISHDDAERVCEGYRPSAILDFWN